VSLKNFIVNDSYQQLQLLLLFGITITLPLPYYGLNNIAIIAFAATGLIKLLVARPPFALVRNILLFLPAVLSILYLIGVIYSDSLTYALSVYERKAGLILMPLGFLGLGRIRRQTAIKVLGVFLASCFFISLVSLINRLIINAKNGIAFTYNNHWHFSEENLSSVFGRPVYLSMFLCFSIVIALFLLKKTDRLVWRICLIGVSFYFTIFIFALASRMAFITLIVLAGFYFFLYLRQHILIKIVSLIIVLTAGVAIAYQFPFLRQKFTGLLNVEVNVYNSKYNAGVREKVWRSAWEVIKDNWVVGVGTGDLQELLQLEYKKINYEEGYTTRYNTHNQFLDTIATVGIIGLAVLVAIISIPFVLALKNRDFLLLSFIVIVFCFFASESVLARQKGVAFFALFYCLLIVNHLFIFKTESELSA
jgi:O-antigen ligase